MSCWIFVINDTDEAFAKRMRDGKWPIYAHTPNRKKIDVGDSVVFYKAGIGGQKFLGSAKISSDIEKTGIDFSLDLTDIVVWDKGLDVAQLLGKLKFVKNKEHWRSYFQGGVKPLGEDDYTKIVNSANDNNLRNKSQ